MPPETDPRFVAAAIKLAFDDYHSRFKTVTRRAKSRFEDQDWAGLKADALERLDVYKTVVDRTVADLKRRLNGAAQDKAIWREIRSGYAALIRDAPDAELAETFFNSVALRVLATLGVDAEIEFVDVPHANPSELPALNRYASEPTPQLFARILSDYRFRVPYENPELDTRLAAQRVNAFLASLPGSPRLDSAETLQSVFYRNKGAYIVGRIKAGGRVIPLLLPLLNGPRGVTVDAVLLMPDEASVVFGFTRSYFHVDADKPAALATFLRSIMPMKPLAEIYISLGHNKHGKTELYRDLMRHMESSTDQFQIARGERGMVMMVFTLPSYDVVFKLIKDTFGYTKKTTRQHVMDRYHLVFKHDRVGRLVDAQEFEHLEFQKGRFSDDLLRELLATCAETVAARGDRVVIKHLYTERRVHPLNLYVAEAAGPDVADAVIDYGNAIRDLAAANIFPGDLLLKNFGVTRHGRVVCYDYDELCLLTDCRIRDFPQAATPDDEFEAEPWFYVGENDFFPEELRTFLGFQGRLRELFEDVHGDLFKVGFWTDMQDRLARSEWTDFFPYKQSRRLRPA